MAKIDDIMESIQKAIEGASKDEPVTKSDDKIEYVTKAQFDELSTSINSLTELVQKFSGLLDEETEGNVVKSVEQLTEDITTLRTVTETLLERQDAAQEAVAVTKSLKIGQSDDDDVGRSKFSGLGATLRTGRRQISVG